MLCVTSHARRHARTGSSTGSRPRTPRKGLRPGWCIGKAHRRENLGYAGRRVLVSPKWSGKTLADHRADRKAWLLQTLGIAEPDPARYTWTLRVERQLTTTRDGRPTFGPAQVQGRKRTVSVPRVITPEMREHLGTFVGGQDEALVFTSPSGKLLNYSNFHDRFWAKAVAKEGPEVVHFHDLRHAGNTLTADAGANLRELMDRMGHSTTRAALTYLHSTDERQRTIAGLIDKRARTELRKIKNPAQPNPPSGTKVARPREEAS